MRKYAVIGGWVTSKYDEERHYISSLRLCLLYKIKSSLCYLFEENDPNKMLGFDFTGIQILRPRYDGNHNLVGK